MSKKILKALCGVLVVLMMLSAAVSCNKKNTPPAPGTTPSGNSGTAEPVTENPGKTEAELPDVDYDGYEFTVKTRKGDSLYQDDVWVGDVPNRTEVQQAIYERGNYLWDAFGIDLRIKYDDSGSNTDTSELNKIQSGTCEVDLIATHGRSAMWYAVAGCAYDWYNLKYVDLNCDWWCQGAVENWTVNDRVYCMTGDLSYMNVAEANCMYFNKSLLRDAGIEYPYQEALDGNWTLERMKQIALEAYDGMVTTGSGKLADDSFAYTSGWWRGAVNLLYSTGTFIMRGNYTGEFELGAYNEIVQNAYTSYLDDFLFDGACNTEAPEDYAKMIKAFKENRVVFYDDVIAKASQFDQTDFGILPFPKYTTDVEGYPTLVNAYSNVFLVPKMTTNPERTSVVLEAMCFYGYQNIIPVYYDKVLSYKISPDPESTQVLQMIRDYVVYDLGYYCEFYGDLCNIGQQCYSAGTAAGMQTFYASMKEIAEQNFGKWDALQ